MLSNLNLDETKWSLLNLNPDETKRLLPNLNLEECIGLNDRYRIYILIRLNGFC